MLNGAFDAFTDSDLDLYPEALREEIDEVNAFVYPVVNDGVYRNRDSPPPSVRMTGR